MLTINPVLKWAGGKARLLPTILEEFKRGIHQQKLTPKKYIEPFLGGASVFLGISETELLPENVILSDLNETLIATYEQIKRFPAELIQKLINLKLKHNKEFYYKTRTDNPENPLDRAARFIYLNRTCFNGLYRVNRKGNFNVPMGNYKNPDITREREIINMSNKLKQVSLMSAPYAIPLSFGDDQSLVYLDPPYDSDDKTGFTSYTESGFTKGDQEALRDEIKRLHRKGSLIIASNAKTKFICDIYQGFTIREVEMTRSINSDTKNRQKVSEVLITNF